MESKNAYGERKRGAAGGGEPNRGARLAWWRPCRRIRARPKKDEGRAEQTLDPVMGERASRGERGEKGFDP